MQAIITAAGPGTRLRPYTQKIPKCMLPVHGRPVLDWVMKSLREAGMTKTAIVKGHGKDFLNYPEITFFTNEKYESTNMLFSLMCAEDAMEEGFVYSYSDILYTPEPIKKLLKTPGEIRVVCDRAWSRRYEGRKAHPYEEAELIDAPDGKVVRIGKSIIPQEEARGEFVGLAYFTPEGSRLLRETYRSAEFSYAGQPDQPFQNAKAFRNAYMTDIFQELVDRGHPVHVADIENGWLEIDTEEDLKYAEANWGKMLWL